MKKRTFIIIVSVLAIACAVFAIAAFHEDREYIAKNPEAEDTEIYWSNVKANYINSSSFTVVIDGTQADVSVGDIYMTADGTLMIAQSVIEEDFGCAVNIYDAVTVRVVKGLIDAEATVGSAKVDMGSETIEMSYPILYSGETLYFPEEFVTDVLGYDSDIDTYLLTASYTCSNEDLLTLPSSYSSEDYDRLPSVKNQGEFGACWAFAALSAIEAGLLPEEDVELSADHLIYNNGFGSTSGGGDQIMSMSYLVSWKGPVYEEDDPYGDSETDSSLSAVYHVQEIQYLESKDYDAIKEAVMLYGAVETSLYIATISDLYIDFSYYNYYRAAYCYYGEEETVNHEVIIVGWDDDYPAEYFEGDVSSDGAFICLNSWGDGFGTEGVFYVSYEDVYIGTTSVVYTKVESADNYDNIYQYDDVGWTANIGYGRNTAYMANVFTASSDEDLEAVGFYAVGSDTDYEVYVITDYKNESSLNTEGEVVYASGNLENSGYYTIELDEAVELSAGEEFAVIVKINTPGSGKPIAYEMDTGTERTSAITTQGKYSYISSYGQEWECTQEEYGANVCLKAYTSLR